MGGLWRHSAYSAQTNRIGKSVVVRHRRENRFNPYGPYNRFARQVRYRRTRCIGPCGAHNFGGSRRAPRNKNTSDCDWRSAARGRRVCGVDGCRPVDQRNHGYDSGTCRVAGAGDQCAIRCEQDVRIGRIDALCHQSLTPGSPTNAASSAAGFSRFAVVARHARVAVANHGAA